MKLNKKEDQCVGAFVFLRKGTKYPQKQLWRQIEGQRLKERPSRDCPTCVFILEIVTKPDTIMGDKKYLPLEANYDSLLRGTARD